MTRQISAKDPQTRARSLRFGQVVRAYRLAGGWSQQTLAARADCDRQSVNRVENCAYAPSLPRIFRLADALNVHPGDLFADAVPDPADLRARRDGREPADRGQPLAGPPDPAGAAREGAARRPRRADRRQPGLVKPE